MRSIGARNHFSHCTTLANSLGEGFHKSLCRAGGLTKRFHVSPPATEAEKERPVRRDAPLHEGRGTRVGLRRPDRAFSIWRDRRCPRTQRRPPRIERIRLTSTAPRLRPQTRDSRGREDVRCAMIGIAEIADRVILHAQRLLDDGAYDWPASRAA